MPKKYSWPIELAQRTTGDSISKSPAAPLHKVVDRASLSIFMKKLYHCKKKHRKHSFGKGSADDHKTHREDYAFDCACHDSVNICLAGKKQLNVAFLPIFCGTCR